MPPIFLIVGAPAVGKSTTSRAVAESFPRSIHIPVDTIRHMVVSDMAMPSTTWSAALVEQVGLARTNVIRMALDYHQAGFAVVIDDFFDPHHCAEYQVLRGHPDVVKVVLFPSQDEAHQRNFRRAGDDPFRLLLDEGIRDVYQNLRSAQPELLADGWRMLDTTSMRLEDVTAAILAMP